MTRSLISPSLASSPTSMHAILLKFANHCPPARGMRNSLATSTSVINLLLFFFYFTADYQVCISTHSDDLFDLLGTSTLWSIHFTCDEIQLLGVVPISSVGDQDFSACPTIIPKCIHSNALDWACKRHR